MMGMLLLANGCAQQNPSQKRKYERFAKNIHTGSEGFEVATLGGCFWCTEAIYLDLRGVEECNRI